MVARSRWEGYPKVSGNEIPHKKIMHPHAAGLFAIAVAADSNILLESMKNREVQDTSFHTLLTLRKAWQ